MTQLHFTINQEEIFNKYEEDKNIKKAYNIR
ncbi:hypothetical protein ABID14_000517 [Peptoniphilus olsenii]|uniref:Transposase n=1 Tax=Peptoniphilus olsenii TaxID=411570 RepID=A0ABV2J7Y3_9FIRM